MTSARSPRACGLSAPCCRPRPTDRVPDRLLTLLDDVRPAAPSRSNSTGTAPTAISRRRSPSNGFPRPSSPRSWPRSRAPDHGRRAGVAGRRVAFEPACAGGRASGCHRRGRAPARGRGVDPARRRARVGRRGLHGPLPASTLASVDRVEGPDGVLFHVKRVQWARRQGVTRADGTVLRAVREIPAEIEIPLLADDGRPSGVAEAVLARVRERLLAGAHLGLDDAEDHHVVPALCRWRRGSRTTRARRRERVSPGRRRRRASRCGPRRRRGSRPPA